MFIHSFQGTNVAILVKEVNAFTEKIPKEPYSILQTQSSVEVEGVIRTIVTITLCYDVSAQGTR
jgi:hypothetical protein